MEGIFGTPPEPLFNDVAGSLKDDGLDDCIAVLQQQNQDRLKNLLKNTAYFKSSCNVEFMFLVCEHFGLAEHAKYLAVDIYDRFMTRHVSQLFEHVQRSASKSKAADWQTVLGRVRSQSYLRMMTSVQLASKLTSHYKIISVKRTWNLLKILGQNYTTEGITASEIRILTVLNFDVMILHPLVFVETLLEVISRRYSSLDMKLYHVVSMQLLDIAYMQRRTLYDNLYYAATGKTMATKEDRAQFQEVEQDNLLLVVAVITSAAYMLDINNSSQVAELLVEKTKIPLTDMLEFASVLVQMAMEDPTV